MDGIAVRALDTKGAGERESVQLAPGQFHRVDAGDPMPEQLDALVMRECVEFDDGTLISTAVSDLAGHRHAGRADATITTAQWTESVGSTRRTPSCARVVGRSEDGPGQQRLRRTAPGVTMCYTVKSIDDVRNLVLATRGLSGLSDLPGLVSKACKRMHRLIEADLAAIAIYDGEDKLVVSAAEGVCADLVGVTVPRGASLGWRALERSMPVTTGNCAADPDSTDDLVDAVIGEGVRGLAAVPIEFSGNWLGVMYAGNRAGRVTPRVTLLMSEFGASLAPLIVTAVRAGRDGKLAVEEERQRIAQQLHDTAGQILFKIAMSARELQRTPPADPQVVARSAREIETDAAEASAYLRQAMRNLMPTTDALPVTIRRDATMFAARTGTAIEVITLGTPTPAKPEIEGVLLSVVREALHNIEKHAGASAVFVSVAYQAREIAVAVADDGKGLPADFELNPIPGRRSGLGIPGLLQKVQSVGGTLRLEANDDGGASVRAVIPIEVAA